MVRSKFPPFRTPPDAEISKTSHSNSVAAIPYNNPRRNSLRTLKGSQTSSSSEYSRSPVGIFQVPSSHSGRGSQSKDPICKPMPSEGGNWGYIFKRGSCFDDDGDGDDDGCIV